MTTSLHLHRPAGFPTADFGFNSILPGKNAVDATVRYTRNVVLFAAAPFVGLAYAVLMPWVGLAMLIWMGAKALVKAPVARRALTAAAFVAAPLIGLAYIVLLPLLGIAMVAHIGFPASMTPDPAI